MTTINRVSRGVCVLLATATILVGCTTLDPYTRDQKTSKATKGALIGAAAGVVVGLVSGDDAVERRQRALLLGGVGALAGGAVGYYMDRQEAKLRQELEGTGVSVTRIGENSKLIFCGDFRQSDLTKQQERQGLLDFMKIIDRLSGFEHIEFNSNDIVRSVLVKEYIIAREELGLCA